MFAKFKRRNFHAVSHSKRNASCDLITENNGRNSCCSSRLRHLRLNIGRVLGHLSSVRIEWPSESDSSQIERVGYVELRAISGQTAWQSLWKDDDINNLLSSAELTRSMRHGLSGRQVLVNGRRPYSISTCIDHFLPAIFSGCLPILIKENWYETHSKC